MASRKVRIQTTIDKEIYEKIIKKWLPKYGHLNALLEEALRIFDASSEHNILKDVDYLSIRMMREVGMFLMGFESGEAILEGDVWRAIGENEIRFMIEWYYKKPIEKMTVEEAINFIPIGLVATNRAHDVKINRVDDDEIHVLVSSKHGKAWNTALCVAIKTFAESHFQVDVDYSVFSHGFELVFREKLIP